MPLAEIAAAISIIDLGVNIFGGMSSAKAQRKMWQRYQAAVREEQARWDKTYGPVTRMWQEYLTGTEGTTNQFGRERAVYNQANSTMRLAAPAIAENTNQAKTVLNENLSARGLGNSGVAAQAMSDLEQQRLSLVGEVRTQALTNAQNEWNQNVQGFLSLGGPRPTMTQMYGEQAAAGPYVTNIDTRATVNSLMKLADKYEKSEG